MATTSAPPIPPKQSFKRRHWGKLTFLALLLVPALIFGIWAFVALTYTYSKGERVGYNQKLSKRGWLCKTWEGELALSAVPGQAPEIFRFSVRDDAVAKRINDLAGQRIRLDYEQHVGVPTNCFGETEYFAIGAEAVRDPYVPGFGPGVPVPATPTPATPTPATPGAAAPAAPGAIIPGATTPAPATAPATTPAVPAPPAPPAAPAPGRP